MISTLTRRALAAAGLTAVVAATALTGPAAYAGGPGQVYVYGDTQSACTTNLDKTVSLYEHNEYVVTGVHACRKTGSGTRWFGDFIAN